MSKILIQAQFPPECTLLVDSLEKFQIATLAGADYYVSDDLIIGMNGMGELQMVGSSGTFRMANLVCSNDVTFAASSELSFVLDDDGVSPLVVTGTAVLTPGTRVSADLTGYAGEKHRFKLIDCSSVDADLTTLKVSATGCGADEFAVVRRTDGLWGTVRKGLVMIVR